MYQNNRKYFVSHGKQNRVEQKNIFYYKKSSSVASPSWMQKCHFQGFRKFFSAYEALGLMLCSYGFVCVRHWVVTHLSF